MKEKSIKTVMYSLAVFVIGALIACIFAMAPDRDAGRDNGTDASHGYDKEKTGENPLFTDAEIAAFNENNPLYVLYGTPEGTTKKLFAKDLGETLSGEIVASLAAPEQYTDVHFPEDALQNCNIRGIPEEATPVYAITTSYIVSKRTPTDNEIPDDSGFDANISSEITPFSGVAVLHTSADGEWSFVLCGSFCGWVHNGTLALCHDRDEWLRECDPERFFVVTGDRMQLDDGMSVPMGTRLPLTGGDAGSTYTVSLPARGEDGFLTHRNAQIPASDEINEGLLKMTSEAVISQAMKYLGHPYGWGGSSMNVDCSGLVSRVYACFGITLPRNSIAIASLSDLGSIDCSSFTAAKKQALLAEMPPGSLLYMDGHIMIYMGLKDGVPQVISAVSSYIPPAGMGDEVVNNRSVIVSGLDLRRKSGKTWLEDISIIDYMGY